MQLFADSQFWSMEGLNGAPQVLATFAPEDLMLIFTCLLSEVNLVFVSQSLHSLSSAM